MRSIILDKAQVCGLLGGGWWWFEVVHEVSSSCALITRLDYHTTLFIFSVDWSAYTHLLLVFHGTIKFWSVIHFPSHIQHASPSYVHCLIPRHLRWSLSGPRAISPRKVYCPAIYSTLRKEARMGGAFSVWGEFGEPEWLLLRNKMFREVEDEGKELVTFSWAKLTKPEDEVMKFGKSYCFWSTSFPLKAWECDSRRRWIRSLTAVWAWC